MSRGIFIQRLFLLCSFHLKVPLHFIAKSPKVHGVHPSVPRTADKSTSHMATTQKTGFLLLHCWFPRSGWKAQLWLLLYFHTISSELLGIQNYASGESQVCSGTDLETTGIVVHVSLHYLVCARPSLPVPHLPSNLLLCCKNLWSASYPGSLEPEEFLEQKSFWKLLQTWVWILGMQLETG